MKPKVLALVVILSLMTFLNASAEEAKISGEATVIDQIVDLHGNSAKFNEYRDIRNGPTGSFDLQYERGKYYLDAYGQEVGRKDQSYEIHGGQWGNFKYDFRYDELPHNFTEHAKTFYNGVGGANLSYTPQPPSTFLPNTNFNTWNTFDYSIERKTFSGGFKLDMLKPFFFGVSAAREERRGVMPIGAAGTSPGGISLELPSPINYLTETIRLEAGYLKDPLSLALRYTYGQFENDNGQLNFRNPATANTAATTDSFTLPPDNDYFKFDFKGALKLPWNSKFNADASYARNESGRNLFSSYVNDNTAGASNIGQQGRTGITLSNYVFNGRLDIQNYNFVFTTNPIYFLDAKLFYKYYQTNNKSSQITTVDPLQSPTSFSNEARLFDYLTYRYGAQIGFKLPMSFYFITSYTGTQTSRKREDIPTYNDDIVNAELRWSGVDFLTARVGYENLHRHGDFHPPALTGPTDSNTIETYFRTFDGAPKIQDSVKATLDLFPIEDLNLSLGYKWMQIRYTDTILGLQTWRGNEFHVDFDYLAFKRVKLFSYFDYEYAILDQFQRTFSAGTAGVFNPANAPTATAFNWKVSETDYNWAFGAGTDVYVVPKKLTLRLQYTFVKSKGFADYTYLLPANLLALQAPVNTLNQNNIDIGNLDNYTLNYFLAKVTYNPIKPLALSIAYVYEKYLYDDAQMNGYQYVPTLNGSILSFLTGAYANQNYSANIWFASASYLF